MRRTPSKLQTTLVHQFLKHNHDRSDGLHEDMQPFQGAARTARRTASREGKSHGEQFSPARGPNLLILFRILLSRRHLDLPHLRKTKINVLSEHSNGSVEKKAGVA